MVDFLRALSIVLLLGMFYLVFKNRKFKRFLLIESVLIIVFIIGRQMYTSNLNTMDTVMWSLASDVTNQMITQSDKNIENNMHDVLSTIYDGNRGANSAFVHKAIYEADFKDELLQINPNYASTSATFQKYVVGAPADNKQGAEADKEATNEGTEDLGTTEGSSQELNIPVESGTGAD